MKKVALRQWLVTFAANLRLTMEEEGISQSRLAKETGISQSTINRYCNGTIVPSVINLNNIACVLDCDIDDIAEFYDYIGIEGELEGEFDDD